MTTPRVPETLAALREATAASHDAIDRQLHLDEEMDLARYVRILAGFERFLLGWEPRVAAALPEPQRAWLAARSRLALLQRDLAFLAPERAAPSSPTLPDVPDLAAAYGSLYVLEGSALGGQLIARRAAARFGFDANRGAAYFNGHGDRTGSLWREFRERLEAEVGPSGRDSACRAAVATFDALRDNFDQVLADGPAFA